MSDFRTKSGSKNKLCASARLKKHRKNQTSGLTALAAEPGKAKQNSQNPQ